MLLGQSVLIAAACILLPLIVFHRQTEWEQRPLAWLAYFAALGLGYIMVEIALLQRFLLFLGQPIYTYAVILAGLLIFTGVGSWIAGRMQQTRALSRSLVVALAVVVITALVTPPVFQFFLGYALGVRIAISLLLVAPLGLSLGMPFPRPASGERANYFDRRLGLGCQRLFHGHRHRACPDPGHDFRLSDCSATLGPVLRRSSFRGRQAGKGFYGGSSHRARKCVSVCRRNTNRHGKAKRGFGDVSAARGPAGSLSGAPGRPFLGQEGSRRMVYL